MDTFDLHENFITPTEQARIIAWAQSNKLQCVDRQNLHGGGIGRRFSRSVRSLRPVPNIIDVLGNRMEVALKMTTAHRLRYKLVIHEVGADTADHIDAYNFTYPLFFRAALLIQASIRGGIFRVNQTPINFPERSLLSFIGNSMHEVTEVIQGERILLRANWYRDPP